MEQGYGPGGSGGGRSGGSTWGLGKTNLRVEESMDRSRRVHGQARGLPQNRQNLNNVNLKSLEVK